MTTPARTPVPPYYAVVFTSVRLAAAPGEPDGYAATAARMVELAAEQPGFLGVESARDPGPDGLGVTVSYWESEEAIAAWRGQAEHTLARERGRADWYRAFVTRVCRVERAYAYESVEAAGEGR